MIRRETTRSLRAPLLAAALALACACAADKGPGRVAADAPARAQFSLPGEVLVLRCGSLDCHGNAHRNYRLVGYGSARLDGTHRPDGPDTTPAEVDANYDATVGIEPEHTRAIAAGTERPEAATLVRKARGGEAHVGGARIGAGSPADACLVGWLRRAPNDTACSEALAALRAENQAPLPP